MSTTDSMLLGLLQGFTEFLPISSSGHLVILEKLLNTKSQGIYFEVFVHFGTALAIIVAFWNRIRKLLISFASGICNLDISKRGSEESKLLFFLLLGSIPTGGVGLFWGKQIEGFFSNPSLVCLMFILTGIFIWPTSRLKPSSRDLNYKSSLLIGLSQALAIIPGISRSGSTISTGLYYGVQREKAVEFSFILAFPAILGATGLKIGELFSLAALPPLDSLLIGTAAACGSGYAAIRLLLKVVRKGRLDWFSYYLWAIGIIGLVLLSW